MQLLERSRDDRYLLVRAHHVVVDMWSMGMLLGELGELYAARLHSRPPLLPPPGPTPSDYAARLEQFLHGPAAADAEAFWRHTLADPPPPLQLPTDLPRPPSPSFRGASVPFRIEPPLADRLRTLARQHDATLHTLLLAAFALLLGRLSGQDDLEGGVPAANRRDPAFHRLVGYLVNPLPIRIDLSGRPAFRDLLAW